MPGPAPKPAAQRRRRNVTTGRATLPAGGRGGRAPTLPGGKDMLAETRRWWRTVWASPMATAWIDADLPALVRLANLQDLVARELRGWTDRERIGEIYQDEADQALGIVRVHLAGAMVSTSVLAEMRQLEDRLGLTPMARRKLEWEIADDGAGAAEPAGRDELADARQARFQRAAS